MNIWRKFLLIAVCTLVCLAHVPHEIIQPDTVPLLGGLGQPAPPTKSERLALEPFVSQRFIFESYLAFEIRIAKTSDIKPDEN